MMHWVGQFSGGLSSWVAAKRAAHKYGVENGVLLFADTGMEDEDLYRFLPEAAQNIGAPLITLKDGRTIWQVFQDVRFLGNHLVDPCSKILKRQLLNKWVAEHCDPLNTVLIYGFDWSEEHRLRRMIRYGGPWRYEAPLLEQPYLTRNDLMLMSRANGIEPPRLYKLGFPHNNCGGGCVKAGQASFALLLRMLPKRYLEWEQNEQAIRDYLERQDITILQDRSGGTKKPLTLKEFRERQQAGLQYDLEDWGSCGCFQTADLLKDS